MPLETGRISAICFDIDGTLSDTDDQWVHRLKRLLYPIRGLFPKKDTHPFARWLVMGLESPGNLVYETLDRLGLDDEAGRLVNAIARRRKDQGDHPILIPGVDEMLATLASRFPLAVVSGRGEHTTLNFLKRYHLLPHFQVIATAWSCEYTKPFPHPIHWAADQMGVKAGECLMVGDTTMDIRAGRAAGAQTVGVLCGFGREGELRRAGADLILASTPQLIHHL